MDLTGVEVAAYERVSKDMSGRERSPEEQHDGHLITCDRFGWTLQTPTYREVGSASNYQRKARDKFDLLLADMESGRFTARVLMLYSSNRGSRMTEEWLRLINLSAALGVQFWIDQHDRLYDPKKPRDRKQLIDDASKSELEVAEMSQTIRRTTAASALRGLPHGRLPFGYLRRYDERTRKFVSQEPNPKEAPIVQEMYARVRKGHSLKSIARDLNKRGLYRRNGGEWVPQNIALMLLHEVYIGIRVHDPGRKSGYHRMTPNAVIVKGQWEPLVSKEVFYSVKKILRDPSRNLNERPGAIVHFLSGIAVCDKCSEVLRVNRRRGVWKYLCVKNHCVTIDQDDLDKFVEEALLELLSDPDLYRNMDQHGDDIDDELMALRGEIAEATEELDDLAARVNRRELGLKFAAAIEPGLRANLAKLEQRERDLLAPRDAADLIAPGPDVAKRWNDAEMPTRRAVARRHLAELGLLGQVRVRQAGPLRHRQRIPAEQRTVFVQKQDEHDLAP